MPNGHIASKLQEVNLYKQNAMLARATYVNSRNNTRAIIYACIAVLSWSTVATAFKIALTHLTHFEMLLIASRTSLLIFADLPEDVETTVCIACPAMGIFCIVRLTESSGLLSGVV